MAYRLIKGSDNNESVRKLIIQNLLLIYGITIYAIRCKRLRQIDHVLSW